MLARSEMRRTEHRILIASVPEIALPGQRFTVLANGGVHVDELPQPHGSSKGLCLSNDRLRTLAGQR